MNLLIVIPADFTPNVGLLIAGALFSLAGIALKELLSTWSAHRGQTVDKSTALQEGLNAWVTNLQSEIADLRDEVDRRDTRLQQAERVIVELVRERDAALRQLDRLSLPTSPPSLPQPPPDPGSKT